MSVKRRVRVGVYLFFFFKECCFRVRVRLELLLVSTLTLTLTLKQHSLKKEIDPDPRFTDSRRSGWWSVAVIVKEMLTGSL